MKEIRYDPIGIIHSPFKDMDGIPIQPIASYGTAGTADVKPHNVDGLVLGRGQIFIIEF
jgi:tRNA (Thr-GGU) A37 N-methylase